SLGAASWLNSASGTRRTSPGDLLNGVVFFHADRGTWVGSPDALTETAAERRLLSPAAEIALAHLFPPLPLTAPLVGTVSDAILLRRPAHGRVLHRPIREDVLDDGLGLFQLRPSLAPLPSRKQLVSRDVIIDALPLDPGDILRDRATVVLE